MNTFIYALIDPRDNQVRYVGKSNDPQKRYRKHLGLWEIYNIDTIKNRWLKKLLLLDLKPILLILEECSREMWPQREIYWINHYKSLGCKMVNSTGGGLGVFDIVDGVRNKKIYSQTGSRNHNFGKKATEETKLKMSLKQLETKKRGKSKFFGVHWDSYTDKWRSSICVSGKTIRLGRFLTEIDAAKERDKYVLENNLPYKLNFGD